MPPRENLGGASSVSPSDRAAPRSPSTSADGRKEDDLSEDEKDLALKARLDLCVMRAQDPEPGVQRAALEVLRQEIRTATSSIISVPKPLKFLRPHYGAFKAYFKTMPQSIEKNSMADILSVLAWTMSSKGERVNQESLNYRSLRMTSGDGVTNIHLAGEIVQVFQNNQSEGVLLESLIDIVLKIAEFYIKHNSEPEAVDLLLEVMEVKDLDDKNIKALVKILSHGDNKNYKRTCLYIISCSKYLPAPHDQSALRVVYEMCMMFSDHIGALQAGLLLHCDEDNCPCGYVKRVFTATRDFHLKQQQLAYIIARHGLCMDIEDYMVADVNQKEALQEIVYNSKLSKNYLTLAQDVGVMEPKSPEDIYKVHLNDDRDAPSSSLYSARNYLAAAFVNAFVNAGFGRDKHMTIPSDSSGGGSSRYWIFKNEEHRKASVVASLGMIFLWDSDSGLAQLGEYLHSNDTDVVAGALLGIGIARCGLKNDLNPELSHLRNYISSMDKSIIRIGAILGLGISYAGSQNAELSKRFMDVLSEYHTPFEVSVFSAISLGLVSVGSRERDYHFEQSIYTLLEYGSEAMLAEPIARLLPLSLGLLYLGNQLSMEDIKDISELFPEKMKEYCKVTLTSLAYAGTGNVLKVQEMLHICSQHREEGETHHGSAVLGIALIAMAEVGAEMTVRSLEHLLEYSEQNIRKVVPLALGVLFISNPKVNVMDILSKLSHDGDAEVSMAAIISLGLIGAGSNSGRVAGMLRNLSSCYYKEDEHLFCVRIAQGLVHLGKGLLTLSPYHSDRLLLSIKALAGLVTVLYASLDMRSIILGKYHYILYILVLAMQPRMLLTVDENLKPLPVPVHVGQAVDVVGQPGKPKTITGFQTHSTPVLLAAGERAELAIQEYDSLTPVLEGVVILKKNQCHTDFYLCEEKIDDW